MDKIIANILRVTRNKVKLIQENGDIVVIIKKPSNIIDVIIHKDIPSIDS